MASVDLHLVKRALLAVGAAAVMLCGFFLIAVAAIIWRDHDRPQFLYEVVITIAGAIYFGALAVHAWRGVKRALLESRLAEAIRFLSQSVLGMFIPVAMVAALLIWLAFQPAY